MVFYEECNIRPRNPDGTLKSIGVSNFSIKTLEELLKTAKVVPAVNQIDLECSERRRTPIVPETLSTRIPPSASEAHQKENLNLPTLDLEDVERITALDKGLRVCNNPTETGIICGWSVERMGWK
ncbi:hypothetical protein AB1N83_010081 [Pleurotus pulmonarius]